jgi:hypothetical protein
MTFKDIRQLAIDTRTEHIDMQRQIAYGLPVFLCGIYVSLVDAMNHNYKLSNYL